MQVACCQTHRPRICNAHEGSHIVEFHIGILSMHSIHLQHKRLRRRVIRCVADGTKGDACLAAFVIVDVTEVNDEPTYAKYRKGAPSTLAAHGRTYLVRGRKVETLEGNWRPSRVVVVRFTLSRLHASGGKIQAILN